MYNDIAKHLLSLTRPFADDSSLFFAAGHIADIAGMINHDLHLLTSWARQWLVTFNPLKLRLSYLLLKKTSNTKVKVQFAETDLRASPL